MTVALHVCNQRANPPSKMQSKSKDQNQSGQEERNRRFLTCDKFLGSSVREFPIYIAHIDRGQQGVPPGEGEKHVQSRHYIFQEYGKQKII